MPSARSRRVVDPAAPAGKSSLEAKRQKKSGSHWSPVAVLLACGVAVLVVCFVASGFARSLKSTSGDDTHPSASPESSQLPQASAGKSSKADILARLQEDPTDLGTLQELCDLFDRSLSLDRTEDAAEDVVNCRSTFLAMLEGSVADYGEAGLEMAVISADRVLALSRGDTERLETAEKGFVIALGDRTRCEKQGPLLPFGDQTAGSCVRAWAKLTSVLRQLGRSEADLPDDVWRGSSKVALPHLQLPGLRAQPTWDPAELSWLTDIGDELRAAVQAEWPAVSTHGATTQTFIARAKGDWSSHTMFIGDAWDEELCGLCPRTCKLLRPLRELRSTNARLPSNSVKAPELLATFHALQPGGKILPHFGSHGRLVVSLGVEGLEGAEIRVGESTLKWSKDRFIVFDDAFDHEVTNHGSSARVVFSICVLHPDIIVPP